MRKRHQNSDIDVEMICSIAYYLKPCDTIWTEIINTNTEIETSEAIIIYPNPVQSVLEFDEQNNNFTQYQILNMSGKLVKQGKFVNNIDVNFLPSATYLIRIFNKNFNYKTLKFIKS